MTLFTHIHRTYRDYTHNTTSACRTSRLIVANASIFEGYNQGVIGFCQLASILVHLFEDSNPRKARDVHAKKACNWHGESSIRRHGLRKRDEAWYGPRTSWKNIRCGSPHTPSSIRLLQCCRIIWHDLDRACKGRSGMLLRAHSDAAGHPVWKTRVRRRRRTMFKEGLQWS